MLTREKCLQVAIELTYGLWADAVNKMLEPGMGGASPEQQQKVREMLVLGPRAEGDDPWFAASMDYYVSRVDNSIGVVLGDLGFTDERAPNDELLAMPEPEFRHLLEEHWVADLERLGTP